MRVNSTDLQNAFGKYLALVEKEDIIVVKNGKSVAKLCHYSEQDFVLVHEESKSYKITRKKVSYEEYITLVNSSDQRYELIDGEVYLQASPSFNHQIVVSEIAWHFYNFFRESPCRSLTALDVRLFGYATKFEEDPNVVQPDLIVICDEQNVNSDGRYEGVPTLVVEVLSPSTKSKDMVVKLNLYMKSGVLEYWVADLESRCIFQYSFAGERQIKGLVILREGELVRSTAFAGLEIAVRDIFSR